MALLERNEDLEELDRYLREAAGGDGRMAFVAGEAGIGKTSLVRAFAAKAASARVATGACDPLTTPRPLGPLHDMAPQLDADLERRLEDGAARPELFGAFLAAVGRGPDPALVVIEDAHWADDATLDLLRYAGRRISGVPALLVVTYRDDEVGTRHPLRMVLGDLAGTGSLRRMRLSPLSRDALARLAADARAGVDVDDLHRRTGGNPFYATEVLAADVEGVPDTVIDAVLARAGRLPSEARRALDAAAVIGARFDPDLVMQVADVGPERLDACLSSGMIVSAGHGLAFRHELGRSALLHVLPPARARDLHRRALRALRAASDGDSGDRGRIDPAALAHHAEGAGDAEAVLRYAPVAAREAVSAQAHREAAAQYGRALAFAAGLNDAERAPLLEAFARECQVTDRVDDSIDAFAEAAALRRSTGDLGTAAVDLARMSRSLVATGRNADSDAAAREAMDLAEESGSEAARAFALLNQSYLRMLDRDNPEALRGAQRALRIARAIGDVPMVVQAGNVLGSVMILTGAEAEGRRELEESLRLAMEHGLDGQAADALGNLGSGFGEVYRFELADRYLDRGAAFCLDRELEYQRMYILAWRAITHAHQGRWGNATADASAVARRPGTSAISRIMALLALGRVRARRGDPDVWDALDEAAELADASGTLQRVGPVRAARAEAAWLEGDADRTIREARAAFDLAVAKDHPWFAGELAYWRWKAADLHVPPDVAAEPFALQITGRWREAAAAWDERNCPYERARAWAESDDAGTHEDAAAIFGALGARPALERLAAASGAIDAPPVPRGPRPSTKRNPAGLTNRQVDVLELVADGLTNAEIAARLFRSQKTIEHHVSAILAKLDVRNRTEAAHRAAELGVRGQLGGEDPPT